MSRKNFTLQSFRQQPGVDQAAAQKLWESLRKAIGEIYLQNASSLSFEELYRNAYNLVLHKHYDLLYEGVQNTIRDHLTISLVEIVESNNEDLLAVVARIWSFHTIAFNMMKDILMYMDRSYAIPRRKATVYTMALQLFREVIVYNPTVCSRLRSILLQEILHERQGQVIDRGLIKNVLSMLVDLGIDGVAVYEQQFEYYFLEETKKFYRIESLAFLSENTCPDYLAKADTRLGEEAARVIHYLAASTEPKLRSAVEEELISTHSRVLLEMENSGFTCMLRDSKMFDLRRMYAIFSRLPKCLEMLREVLGDHVKQSGTSIISSQECQRDPVGFVRNILDLKQKYDGITRGAFRSENAVQKIINDSFSSFINVSNKCASHLASYVDELLRGGGGGGSGSSASSSSSSASSSSTSSAIGMGISSSGSAGGSCSLGLQGATEVEVEEKLEQVLVIFKFLADKDIFENYYKNLLSKRLLGNKSISDEIEKQMIAKFKAECGYQFTTKLEGMFQDMSTSKKVQDDFRASAFYAQAGVQMDVHMLRSGCWPLDHSPPCALPPAIQQATDAFTACYLGTNSGRKLTWLTNLGSVEMKANFPGGKKDLTVSFYQMCILLLFNEQASLGLEEIIAAVQIPEVELRRHLLSLCTTKIRILKKQSKGKGIVANDNFQFNDEFTSKFKRMKVPLISLKDVALSETKSSSSSSNGTSSSSSNGVGGAMMMMGDGEEEHPAAGMSAGADGDIPSAVEAGRVQHVEAAVVRVMKARKTMTHNELVAEIIRQLSMRFTPSPQFIKRRVESLIEREYLKRDENDTRVYQYLA